MLPDKSDSLEVENGKYAQNRRRVEELVLFIKKEERDMRKIEKSNKNHQNFKDEYLKNRDLKLKLKKNLEEAAMKLPYSKTEYQGVGPDQRIQLLNQQREEQR